MGFTIAQGLMLVLLIASTMAISTARPFGNSHNTQTSNKIIVGDSYHWNYGFNYTEWAIKHGPFYLNDTLVFKYDPPTPNTNPHNVYLLENLERFIKCDFTNAQKVANETQGGGEGFEFVLERPWQPHYFACTVHEGIHCLNGTMKFFVTPICH
ncbi:cucumber peeling cupredoxin [Quercus suber]|uniref:Cucumber peeling cupredoxin n=1 Tax=Quercus suber TaxID=58331 RepID=A0AAW0IY90_QUESU|nr:cucumber peeling cupredoxin-like [Quercus suber]POE61088.1 cucumber peeling cupredoxin [Quercus suber]